MMVTEFGKRIAELRTERKLTQAELAERLNVSTQAVSKWETGAGFPDVQTIPQIAHILETTTDFLFGCINKKQKVLIYCAYQKNPTTGRFFCEEEINDQYLNQGWKIVDFKPSAEQEYLYIVVVLERNNF